VNRALFDTMARAFGRGATRRTILETAGVAALGALGLAALPGANAPVPVEHNRLQAWHDKNRRKRGLVIRERLRRSLHGVRWLVSILPMGPTFVAEVETERKNKVLFFDRGLINAAALR
jgi:hypothetical protein